MGVNKIAGKIFQDRECRENAVVRHCLMAYYYSHASLEDTILAIVQGLVQQNKNLHEAYLDHLIKCPGPPVIFEKQK